MLAYAEGRGISQTRWGQESVQKVWAQLFLKLMLWTSLPSAKIYFFKLATFHIPGQAHSPRESRREVQAKLR